MVATAVLSLGMLFVYESFFSVLKAFDYCSTYLSSVGFVQEKLWTAADSVMRDGSLGPEVQGEYSSEGKTFAWNLWQESAGGELYRVGVRLNWKAGKRDMEISRYAYAIFHKTQ